MSESRFRIFFVSVLVAVVVVGVFLFWRFRVLNRDVTESVATGKIVSQYSCGMRTNLKFFRTGEESPYRMFQLRGDPVGRFECVKRALLFTPRIEEMSGQVEVFVDIESDGDWVHRLLFDGQLNDLAPIDDVKFQYFERDRNGLWERVTPIDKQGVLNFMLFDDLMPPDRSFEAEPGETS